MSLGEMGFYEWAVVAGVVGIWLTGMTVAGAASSLRNITIQLHAIRLDVQTLRDVSMNENHPTIRSLANIEESLDSIRRA